MARYCSTLSLAVLISMGVGGCAAPIKALMQNTSAETEPKPAAAPATSDSDMLRLALAKRAAALRQEADARPAAPTGGTERAQRLPANRLDNNRLDNNILPVSVPTSHQPSARVMEMLARTQGAKSSTDGGKAAQGKPATLALSKLSTSFQVKDEARLASPGTAVPERADQPRIRFESKSTALDSAGNSVLATLVRNNPDMTGYRIVIVGGLAGPGQAWEKMQLAASRIETIANHVPPPIKSERQFDPALDVGEVRLELREARLELKKDSR